MNGLRQIVELLSEPFAITEVYAKQMSAMAYLFLNNRDAEIFSKLWVKEELNNENDWHSSSVLTIPSEDGRTNYRVAVMDVSGPMMRSNTLCGPEGSISRAKRLQALGEQKDIDGIVMKVYSPGGQIHGGEIFQNAVKEVSEIKPIVAWVEMAGSLAYRVIAGSSSIVLSGHDAMVGSIGTGFIYKDKTQKLENEGIREIEITATSSPDKWKHNLKNPSDTDLNLFAVEMLDPLDANFMQHIKEQRPQISEHALRGNIYYGQAGIDNGLADHIGSFESAVQLVLDMAGKPGIVKSNKMSKETDTTQTATPSPGTQSAGGTQGSQAPAQGSTTTPDTTAQASQIAALQAQVESQERTILALNQTIQVQGKTITTLQGEVERLEKLPSTDTEAATTVAKEDLSQNLDEKPKSYSEHQRDAYEQRTNRTARPVAREFVNLN